MYHSGGGKGWLYLQPDQLLLFRDLFFPRVLQTHCQFTVLSFYLLGFPVIPPFPSVSHLPFFFGSYAVGNAYI